MRQTTHFTISDPDSFKHKLIAFADTAETAVYLDSNQYPHDTWHRYDILLAVGSNHIIDPEDNCFTTLEKELRETPDWYFGYFGYDLKNEVEDLCSDHQDNIKAPDLYFFQPETVIAMQGCELSIHTTTGQQGEKILDLINAQTIPNWTRPSINSFQARMLRSDYLQRVEAIRQHIIRGDIYEMNLCQEFFATDVQMQPSCIFQRFNQHTRSPFAAYLKMANIHVLCSSPERFLAKRGNKLISQPIKGTNSRLHPDEHNTIQRNALYTSEKDRAENVMIVDLVRNDLARSCESGSVKVDELFGIYTFNQVNQMISTVTGTLKPDVSGIEAIRRAFPMGSMTGAPKVKAMELIEKYEITKRGIYSGAIGYFDPEGNFDLNVVIRSMIYHQDTRYLSYHAGGAIVYDSDPHHEYEECLLKAKGMTDLFGLKL